MLRLRLRSMMVLVLMTALGTAACLHLSRLEPEDVVGPLAMLGPFLILIVLKMGLALGHRLRRGRPDGATEGPREDRPKVP